MFSSGKLALFQTHFPDLWNVYSVCARKTRVFLASLSCDDDSRTASVFIDCTSEMRRTLFLIPHEVAGLPVLGVGWLLIALAIYIVARLVWASRKKDAGPSALEIIAQEGVLWALMAAIVVFVLPRAEIGNIAGDPVGLPVRGYGMFLMLAAIGSVGMAAYRAERAGLRSETILKLAPWTFIGGLAGARLFYVIQYRHDFIRESWSETLLAMAAFTQGGLVVYGGFIGGFLASVWAIRRFHGSIWRLGDVIVPCMFVGLFFGRLGCLMNGCCYGGHCEPNLLSVQFPPGSGVYSDQLQNGELIGVQAKLVARPVPLDQSASLDPAEASSVTRPLYEVESVAEGSLAQTAGVQPGDRLDLIPDTAFAREASLEIPAEDARIGLAVVRDGELLARYSPAQLPDRASPVWATQIISSVVAAVMFGLLLLLERLVSKTRWYREGLLMLTGFVAYAILRIILEWVRVDEAGQFGTSFSISQWVSFAVIIASAIAIAFRLKTPPASTSLESA
ncbi:phosphatidylglycerol:prolipoprotein diacylglycerol transferase [Neorhodopirellula lusitana]|uniref:Phosphatidylglycerol--prolipoprotein diacylglyceryl transferase n=2 Tax=Neorhodopirellula lusitana TaxID=445327 RepID=A0ABY1PQ13_9BACT|nr:phosphatidylglycerol:prolipoprotein diacylglycerol transferase [Neorhodopirellula lusitana]